MSAPSSIPIESLLVHSDWVRGLVARLVYDPSLADDVLQETWRLSLERPPREDVDLRGWLGQVARNAHRHLLRRESRLKRREESVARGEGLPDVVDVIAKVDLQRRMAEAVLGLDEPYRSCVLMRYFEELPPREIAARLGAPVNTVRSRVARGLAQLRSELDTEYGDRRSWAVAFLPLIQGARGKGPVALKSGGSIGAAVWIGVLSAVTVLWLAGRPWSAESDNASLVPPQLSVGVVEHRSDSLELVEVAQASQERRSETGRDTPADRGEVVTFVDPSTDEPVAGVRWWVLRTGRFDAADRRDEELTSTPTDRGVTAADGAARFSTRGDALVHLFTARTGRFARGSWPVRAEDMGKTDLRLTLSRGVSVKGRLVDMTGHPIAGAKIVRRTFFFEEEELGTTAESGAFLAQRMAPFPRRYMLTAGDEVVATRTDSERVRFAIEDAAGQQFRLQDRWSHWEIPPGSKGVIDLGDIRLIGGGILRGTVVDSGGRPLAGALVSPGKVRISRVPGRSGGNQRLLPWEAGGRVLPDECLTDRDGSFAIWLPSAQDVLPQSLCAIAPNGAGVFVEEISPTADQSWSSIRIEIPPADGFQLHLVDPQGVDGALSNLNRMSGHLRICSEPADGDSRVSVATLVLPKSGTVRVERTHLNAVRAQVILMIDGYRPAEVELDLAERELTVELEREPVLTMHVSVEGPGASKVEAVHISVSALPPVTEAETAGTSLLGPAGTRRIGYVDFGQYEYSLKSAFVDAPIRLPRPNVNQVWVYVEPLAPAGYEPALASAFGPLSGEVAELECVIQAAPWRVLDASIGAGERAAFNDDRIGDVRMHVVSSVTGEPIEGAGYMQYYGGKLRRVSKSDESGLLEASVGGNEAGCRISHPHYRDVELGPIQATPGTSLDLGQFALEPLLLLEGQLLDRVGRPLRASRKIRWTDAQLGERLERSADDGSFTLGVTEPPEFLFVGHPESRWQSHPKLGLLAPEGAGRWTCRVPSFTEVCIKVVGLPPAARVESTPIFVRRDDGTRTRIWGSLERAQRVVFRCWLPAGHYGLESGWIIAVEPLHFEVPERGASTQPALDPIVLQVTGNGPAR